MLNRLTIQDFKGIHSCEVKDLKRINLFIGKNDSGKSTIMEAAYYLLRELYGPPQLQAILAKRTDVFTGGSELWFKYNTDSTILVSATFDSVSFDWRIVLKSTGTESYISSNLFGGKVQLVLLGETRYRGRDFSMGYTSGKTMVDNLREGQKFKDELVQYISDSMFIDCTIKSRTRDVERVLARFKISPTLEEKFGNLLNEIYGKGKEWQFIPQLENTDEKRFAIKEAGQFKYFSGFGDGLRSCVGILGTAMSIRDSALFIEEIESHQHAGSLNKLIKHLVEIARGNNLQIFLSTHSQDVWNSLARGVYVDDVEREKKEFNCFLTERDSESGKVTADGTDDVQKITQALSER